MSLRSANELDFIAQSLGRGLRAHQILNAVNRKRRASKTKPLKIWAVRRAMKGNTHKRGRVFKRVFHDV